MKSLRNRTIILPIGEQEYNLLVDNKKLYKNKLNTLLLQYPEIFPAAMQGDGYHFVGTSKDTQKVAICRRIIRLKHPFNSYDDYLLHPCFVMPYLRGQTIEVSKGLAFRKHSTPYYAIANGFGKDPMYWYRAELSLSQYNIVGTTIKKIEQLPAHILIDEHHSKLFKEKVYACTTVGHNCFLGVGVSPSMQATDLIKTYGQFKNEISRLCPFYMPTSVNMDGFKSTKKAASILYPLAAVLRCFLHSFLKIRNCGTKAYDLYFKQVADRVWHCYYAPTKLAFAQRLWHLAEWTKRIIPTSPFKNAILQLCKKKRIYNTL